MAPRRPKPTEKGSTMFYMTIADMNKAERELEALFGWDVSFIWFHCNLWTTDQLNEDEMDFMNAVFEFMDCWRRAEYVAYDCQLPKPSCSKNEVEDVFEQMETAAQKVRRTAKANMPSC